MDYGWYLLTLFGIYGAVAVSLVVVVGDLGLLTVAHAAVFGTGAYLAALAELRGHLPFEVSLIIGALGGAFLMLMLALVASRLSRDRFVLATVALQVGFTGLAQNLTNVTGGAQGLLGVPGLSLLGHRLEPGRDVALAALCLLAFSLVLISALRREPYANALHCVRDAELFARSVGLRPVWYRALPMALVGGVTGVAGAMFGGVLMFVDPSPYRLADSCLLLAMVALGAGRSLRLALCGTIMVVGIPEILRFVGVPGTVVGNVRQIIGATILAVASFVFFHLEAGERQGARP
jgi:branched-chain amino acid transport system permease protein